MASFFVLVALLVSASCCFGEEPSCSTVKIAYRSKRLTEEDVPSSAVDGNDLRVCPKDNGKQCCSQRMEERFTILSRGDFDDAVSSKVQKLKGLFNEQAKTFDGYFRGLIKKSQEDLDTMFKTIYGYYYEQNTKIFLDLFVDMTDYYSGKTSADVNSIMDKFFTNLMNGMFQIMNDRHHLSDSYLNCVSRRMEQLQPFGDIPQKLKPQVRKVLIHARYFSQALYAGGDVVHLLENAAASSKDCENNLVNLKYCSWCKAMTAIKPCFKFCSDVYKGCVADLAKVNTQWQSYVAALKEILEKQTGPTNIHDVMTGINVKISFAIMNFQQEDKMKEVKEKVLQAKECGSPGLTKRSTDDFFLEGSNRQGKESDSALARTASSQVNLDKLSTNFKEKMKLADNFWSALSDKICDDISVKDENSDCWNGVGKGSYTSLADGGNDMEDETKPVIQKAIKRLEEVVDQLNAAINGDELDNISGDDEDGSVSASGSGSGSGVESGNEITEEPDPYTPESENEIDGNDEGEVMAGGVGNPKPGSGDNSAAQHHVGLWLLSSTLWVLLAVLLV